MLNKLKAADFQPLLNQDFNVAVGEETITMKLAEVSELGQSVREGGSFSLVFVSPKDTGLEQGVFGISHEAIDNLDLFLVPIGQFGDGEGYESVFT